MRYHFVLHSYPAFDEACAMIRHTANELDRQITTSYQPVPGVTNIVIGPANRPNPTAGATGSVFGYTFDQHLRGTFWCSDRNLAALRSAPLWSYDPVVADRLKSFRIHAQSVPVGYSPAWENQLPDVERDIDVAFIGSAFDHRKRILDACSAAGLKVAWPMTFGKERDAVYSRAKVYLSLASWRPGIFQSLRIGYLAANRRCVVSDPYERPELYPYTPHLDIVDPERIVERCRELVASPKLREESIERLHEGFKAHTYTDNLRRALDHIENETTVALALAAARSGSASRFRIRIRNQNCVFAIGRFLKQSPGWFATQESRTHYLLLRKP